MGEALRMRENEAARRKAAAVERARVEAERVRTARAAEEKRKADQAARDRREAEERRRLEELERRTEERERKRMHMAELEARKRFKLAENEMERKRQDATTVAADDAKRQRRSHGASTDGGCTSIDLSDPIGAYCRSHATGGATADCTQQEATVEGDDVKRQRRSHGVSAEGGSTAFDHSDPVGAYCRSHATGGAKVDCTQPQASLARENQTVDPCLSLCGDGSATDLLADRGSALAAGGVEDDEPSAALATATAFWEADGFDDDEPSAALATAVEEEDPAVRAEREAREEANRLNRERQFRGMFSVRLAPDRPRKTEPERMLVAAKLLAEHLRDHVTMPATQICHFSFLGKFGKFRKGILMFLDVLAN